MSTRLQSDIAQTGLAQAERMKRELVAFATVGFLKDEYKRQHDLFFNNVPPEDEHEAKSVLDWFLFDWLDETGESAIDHFLYARPDLSEHEQELLLEWENSINTVFEIRALGKSSMRLEELDTRESFSVIPDASNKKTQFKRGQFIVARLLPVGEQFIFSGSQLIMPDRTSANAWLNMRREFDQLESPEALENAQREQCNAFCELFGCQQLTIKPSELNQTLKRFQQYLLVERRDPESGRTAAEMFKEEFGHDLRMPEAPPLLEPLAGARDVTILCDDFDGIVVLPDYIRFRSVFENDNPDLADSNWRELVWTYINEPDIPIVAFERVAEEFPASVESVIRELLGEKDFSLEHLYAVLLHYKQPVDGLDNLEDDEHLWDLFNGNTPANGEQEIGVKVAPKKTVASATAASTRKKRRKKPLQKTKAKARTAKTSSRAPRRSASNPKSKSRAKSAPRKRVTAARSSARPQARKR